MLVVFCLHINTLYIRVYDTLVFIIKEANNFLSAHAMTFSSVVCNIVFMPKIKPYSQSNSLESIFCSKQFSCFKANQYTLKMCEYFLISTLNLIIKDSFDSYLHWIDFLKFIYTYILLWIIKSSDDEVGLTQKPNWLPHWILENYCFYLSSCHF